jgi:hypothetical protein
LSFRRPRHQLQAQQALQDAAGTRQHTWQVQVGPQALDVLRAQQLSRHLLQAERQVTAMQLLLLLLPPLLVVAAASLQLQRCLCGGLVCRRLQCGSELPAEG